MNNLFYPGEGLLVLFWFAVVPLYLGRIICDICKTEKGFWLRYLMGSLLEWAFFELIAVPAIMAKKTLGVVTGLWCGVIVLLLTAGICRCIYGNRRSANPAKPERFRQLTEGIGTWLTELWKETLLTRILFAGMTALIAFQIYMYVFYAHYDADDARYMANSVAAWNNGTMLLTHPNTGVLLQQPLGELQKDVVSPWTIYIAMMAKLTCIHPTVLAHTVFPVFLVLMGYGAYQLLAQLLIAERGYRYLFLTLISVFEIFGYTSIYTGATFFLTRIWQGKSVVVGVILPFVLALMLLLDADYDNRRWHIIVFFMNLGACLLSGVGIVYSAVLVGCFEFCYALRHKNIKNLLLGVLSCMPNLIFGILYAMA